MWSELATLAEAGLLFMDTHGNGLAASAALIGIPFLAAQITQSGRQEKRRLKARRLAALSVLPMTLRGVNNWCDEVVIALKAIYPWVYGDAEQLGVAPTFSPPDSPDAVIAAIERMIEAEPKGRIAQTLAAVVSGIQVLDSRLHDRQDFLPSKLSGQRSMIADNLIRAATIHVQACSLYDDARRLSEDAPVNLDDVATTLDMVMDVRRYTHETVFDQLKRQSDYAEMDRPFYLRAVRKVRRRWENWRSERMAKRIVKS